MDFKEILEVYNIHRREGPRVSRCFRPGRPLVKPPEMGDDGLPSGIFKLLSNKTIRRGEGILFRSAVETYLEQIDFFVKKGLPIEFIFVGFPFKCHNPIETLRRTPDLGELVFLLRLLDIDATVRQVYSPGVKFTVLTEGNAYKDFFGATTEEVRNFEDRLQYFASNLGAEEKISFVAYTSVCKQFSHFEKVRLNEEKNLRRNQLEETTHRVIKALVPVMMRSVPIVEGVPLEDLIKVYDYGLLSQDLTNFQTKLRMRLLMEAEGLAIRYLAFQRAKNELDIIYKTFPRKLRVSTISKQSMYSFHPIHRRTRFFPHHGVPILGPDKIEVIFFKEIIKNPGIYSAVFCPDDIEDAPFYFLKGRQHLKMLK